MISLYLIESYEIEIEIEFLLSFCSMNSAKTIHEFSRMIAASYNNYLARVAPRNHLKKHNAIDKSYLELQFAE